LKARGCSLLEHRALVTLLSQYVLLRVRFFQEHARCAHNLRPNGKPIIMSRSRAVCEQSI
jgi:hypothetical protein